MSLRVEDLAKSYRDLVAQGVRFTAPPETQPWGGSLAHFEDPDGNVLTLLG
ncbi:MAG: VOC family protein [Rhodospirillaceae bacterium]|nr:VOC family protein [Rhodospirillaceae bacterium]